MDEQHLQKLLDELIKHPSECEWIEFKKNNAMPQEIGENISAVANAACLWDKKTAYLVWGVQDGTHGVVGTSFSPKKEKIGNEELENWLARLLNPRIDFRIYEFQSDGKFIVLIEVDPAANQPIKFRGTAYVRVGSYTKKLDDFPEKARKIWGKRGGDDWSAQICEGATVHDLDSRAISKARDQYKKKNPNLGVEVDSRDDITFLNKAKVTVDGKITRAAILLLGILESTHFISPAVAKISWILRDERNLEKDYEHFGPPFILNTDEALAKIRNLKYRYLPDNTLFPTEISQYDTWVIREALHNCIAHQDYNLSSRISIVEKQDELIFSNAGSFLPGTVESVIERDSPPPDYRNEFMANAMVNFGMIDTIGSGIKKMFTLQRERYFPLPTYEIKSNLVTVKISGKIIDENYTRLLIRHTDLELHTIILLDKVQKKIKLEKNVYQELKRQRLAEGRYPNIFVTSQIASLTGQKAKYIKNRAFDKVHYKKMLIAYLEKFERASRKDINELLMDKLSDALTPGQKHNKIKNLLSEMAKKDKTIHNSGSDRTPKWVLIDKS